LNRHEYLADTLSLRIEYGNVGAVLDAAVLDAEGNAALGSDLIRGSIELC
jgi:hypothetical protein